jgi:putative hemolysin
MKTISKEEFSKATGLDKLSIPGLASFLMEVTKINEVNKILNETRHLDGLEFVDKILNILQVQVDFDERELKNFPLTEPFIAVANHPYGGVEGLVLLKMLCSVRPEGRLMANFLLSRIPGISQYLIAVNPFEHIQHPSSFHGLKSMLNMLKENIPVAIFPAGEVSSYNARLQQVTDKQWHPVVGKLISRACVPVVPVYFDGHNGFLFNMLGMVHPSLRTAKLPSELFNKRGCKIRIRIGKPVSKDEIAAYDNSLKLLNYLRARTYMLGAGFVKDQGLLRMKNIFKVRKKAQPVIDEQDSLSLEKEIEVIRQNSKVCEEANYEVFVCEARKIPRLLQEIGRLREITFRDVGEGTNKSIDLDKFDIYYQHLFIWDKFNRLLVGAYRIGKGDEILFSYGKRGFYLAELFHIKKALVPLLEQSLELGRSWVRREYQQKPLPLFLLWKGIVSFVSQTSQYKYLIGPVSISNQFSGFSKSLIVNYILNHHYNEDLASYVRPRKPFKTGFSKAHAAVLLEGKTALKDVDALVSELELANMKVPVLLRQYIALNAKIIAFNIDPKFSDSLDGFLVLDLTSAPQDLLQKLGRKSAGK